MTQESNKMKNNPIPENLDTIISTVLLPITILALGLAYYAFYIKPIALPFILIAALLFGFSCMGLRRMWKLRKSNKWST